MAVSPAIQLTLILLMTTFVTFENTLDPDQSISPPQHSNKLVFFLFFEGGAENIMGERGTV